MTDAIIEDKPKKKIVEMPKGVSVPVKDVQVGMPVHFLEKPPPANQWDRTSAQCPRVGVVTDINPLDANHLSFTIRHGSKGRRVTVNFPKEFGVRQMTGTMGTTLVERYRKWRMENFGQQLGHAFTIGSDPEIFAVNGKGELFPAFEFLGSKKKPSLTAAGQTCYWDGFQAEFTTAAQNCLAWQVDSVQAGLKAVLEHAIKKDKDARLSVQTVFNVPVDMLMEAKEEHVEFGCMPSKNAYGMEGRKRPAREMTERMSGGHIHFGVGKNSDEVYVRMVKALDAVLGVACVSLFENFDNPVRRQYYGLAGEYRTPPHGLEYRSLSSAWLMHPFIMNLVFDLSRKAVVIGSKDLISAFKFEEAEVIETINTCNAKKAREFLTANKAMYLSIFKAIYYSDATGLECLYNVLYNGAESVIKDPEDIAKNWQLKGHWQGHSDGPEKNVIHSVASIVAGKKI